MPAFSAAVAQLMDASSVQDVAEALIPVLLGLDRTTSSIVQGLLGKAMSNNCNCRLSLRADDPVYRETIASSMLYCHPYFGNIVSLYNGSSWQPKTLSSAINIAPPNVANTTFDVFIYDDGGTLKLLNVNWASATARATSLALQNGIFVLTGDTSKRYLGTGRTGSTAGECTMSGTVGGLWNLYNQVCYVLNRAETTLHTYTSATWRSWNNDNTQTIALVTGFEENKSLPPTVILIHTEAQIRATSAGGVARVRVTGPTASGNMLVNANASAIRAATYDISNKFIADASVHAGYVTYTIEEQADAVVGGTFSEYECDIMYMG